MKMKNILIIILSICTINNGLSQDTNVILTKIPSDVIGYERVGEVSASTSIIYGGQKKLRSKTREKIKIQARKLNADIVFINVDNFSNTPINNVNIEGVAYKRKEINKELDTTISENNSLDSIEKFEFFITTNPNDIIGLKRHKEYNVSSSAVYGSQKKLRAKARKKLENEAKHDNCKVALIQSNQFSNSPINTVNIIAIGYK